jgi:hypothetical protein
MPDIRTPNDMRHDDLDGRIRQLVARAVAEAPTPPDITRHEVTIEPHEPDRRRWWIGGGAALVAAAALVIVFVLAATGDDTTVHTPATQPRPGTTVLPAPQPTTPRTSPGTIPATAPATNPTSPPTRPPATTAETGVLTAGPEGVVEHGPDGERVLTTEPMAIAVHTGDGRVLVQRGPGYVDPTIEPAETVPLVVGDDGELTELFGTADWDGYVTMHDVEVVDGHRLLLFSLTVEPNNPDARNETLYVVDLDTRERTRVDPELGGWEFGTGRLHLATTGLVVGESTSGVTRSLYVAAVPGSEAAAGLPSPADVGLEEQYSDCLDCPRAFTVAPDGRTLAWLDGDRRLVIRHLDGSVAPEFQLHEDVLPLLTADFDLGGTQLVISQPSGSGVRNPAIVIDLTQPESAPRSLGAPVATLGPAATLPDLAVPTEPDVTPPPTPSTIPPATTPSTTPSPAGVIDDVVTAGPDGVVVYEDGAQTTITDQPMEMALATGDGRFVVQRRVGYGEPEGYAAADTMPLILSAAGDLDPLWPGREPSWITLHDIEIVDGQRLLVYESDTDSPGTDDPVDPDAFNGRTYVVDLDAADGEPIDLGLTSGWEFGVARLHLATTGLIVAEQSHSAAHNAFFLAVPGSPAADRGLPAPSQLGLQDTYGDCTDCPHTFTVSPHATVYAWLDRTSGIDGNTELVVHPSNGEPESRYDAFPENVNTTLVRDLDYLADGSLVLSYFEDPGSGRTRPPVYINDGQATELSGAVASEAPTGS